MISDLKEIGKRIRDLRNIVDMSQSELAFEVGTDKAYISRIERGEVNIGILLFIKICFALKVTSKEILDV
ncbi:MAG: transcriptional regulator [Gammaproteobacteria bacterium]|nr:MAG: transcriptional regulator [Gammaproteobacteria bacterium]